MFEIDRVRSFQIKTKFEAKLPKSSITISISRDLYVYFKLLSKSKYALQVVFTSMLLHLSVPDLSGF